MFRVKQRADMGESTSPQRIQLEEMVLKDKDDGKEIKTDNGLHARLLHLPVSFSLLPLALKNSYKDCAQKQNAGDSGCAASNTVFIIGLFFVLSLSSC